jgi:hypothetical protein
MANRLKCSLNAAGAAAAAAAPALALVSFVADTADDDDVRGDAELRGEPPAIGMRDGARCVCATSARTTHDDLL